MTDAWEHLVDPFADAAYASVKGQVRTYVMHRQLLRHLPPSPVRVLDVGGGAGHQSLPLARLGYDVTILDSSSAMLAKASERLAHEGADVRARVRLVHGPGEAALELTGGAPYPVVLCHGVLMYAEAPDVLLDELCRCVEPGGVLSVMTLNAATMAVRPALERRWADALDAFEATEEVGVLGLPTRAHTVAELSGAMRSHGLEELAWYGVLLFTDWTDLPAAATDVRTVAEVELAAGSRDPYRQLSRAFHLLASAPR